MTPLTTLQSDAIRDAIALDVETNPTLAAILRDLGRTLPTQGIETTWSKMGALQHSEPDELESATVGLRPAYPTSPAVGAENPFLSDSADLPEGGARVAALHVGGN